MPKQVKVYPDGKRIAREFSEKNGQRFYGTKPAKKPASKTAK